MGHPRPRRSKPHHRTCPLRPESDLHKSRCDPPLRANNGHMQCSKKAPLFDHLVGDGEKLPGISNPSALAVLRLIASSMVELPHCQPRDPQSQGQHDNASPVPATERILTHWKLLPFS